MEEFIFISPTGEVYRKEIINGNARHGDIAYKYMCERSLEINSVDIKEKNGYPWGVELAKYHSTLVIQDGGTLGIIYIPNILTEEQKKWAKKSLLNELELMDGQIFICDFIGDEMQQYNYYDINIDIENQLVKCLKQKGVNIKNKEESKNGIQK